MENAFLQLCRFFPCNFADGFIFFRTPKFSHNALERPYDDIVLNKKEPFEEILSNNEYYLAAATLYSNMLQGLEVVVGLATGVIGSGAEAYFRAYGKDAGELHGAWLNNFKTLIRETQLEGEIPGPVSPAQFNKILQNMDFRAEGDKEHGRILV
ncbi:unnamed protein product, partial [marine sediment metagenome]